MRKFTLILSATIVFLDLSGSPSQSYAADTLADRMKAAQELAGGDNPAKVMALLGGGITNFKAFMLLGGLARSFILGPNDEFYGTRNKQAFASAISNITPAAIDQTKKLIGTEDSALAFGVLLNSSSRFVLKPNEFSSKPFNAAFQHMTEAIVEQTIRIVGADGINAEKALALLLAGSARFVDKTGRFNADAFGKAFASITSQKVAAEVKQGARADAFDALLRP
jgi:hypothetical protein